MYHTEKTTITLNELFSKCRYSKEYDNTCQIANNVLLLTKQLAELKKELDKNKEYVLDYMVKNGIEKIIDTDYNQTITYIDENEKLIIDTKRFKTVYGKEYNDCVKVSIVKAHLKIS